MIHKGHLQDQFQQVISIQ